MVINCCKYTFILGNILFLKKQMYEFQDIMVDV